MESIKSSQRRRSKAALVSIAIFLEPARVDLFTRTACCSPVEEEDALDDSGDAGQRLGGSAVLAALGLFWPARGVLVFLLAIDEQALGCLSRKK
jgi:hypothetical protein